MGYSLPYGHADVGSHSNGARTHLAHGGDGGHLTPSARWKRGHTKGGDATAADSEADSWFIWCSGGVSKAEETRGCPGFIAHKAL